MCRVNHNSLFLFFSFAPQFTADDGEGCLPKMGFNNLSPAHIGIVVHTVYDYSFLNDLASWVTTHTYP